MYVYVWYACMSVCGMCMCEPTWRRTSVVGEAQHGVLGRLLARQALAQQTRCDVVITLLQNLHHASGTAYCACDSVRVVVL